MLCQFLKHYHCTPDFLQCRFKYRPEIWVELVLNFGYESVIGYPFEIRFQDFLYTANQDRRTKLVIGGGIDATI